MNPAKLKQQLLTFEQGLDVALDALPSRQWASSSALRIASELCEIRAFKSRGPYGAEYLDRGYAILAGHFVAGASGYMADISCEADLRQPTEDLVFASHYYMIREYLYYSCNVPGSMAWSFEEGRVEIRFADQSIPRQFFTVHNDQVLGSQYHFRDFSHSAEIMRLLENEPEGEVPPNSRRPIRSCGPRPTSSLPPTSR